MNLPVRLSCVFILLASFSGCGTQEAYREEAFRPDTPFGKRMEGPAEVVCDSVKRALLSQGYLLEPSAGHGVLTGIKEFHRGEDNVALRLQTSCMDNRDGSAMVYAGAQQETSRLQTVKHPASINVGPVGGITLPAGSAKIPVTVKRETIQDPDFYRRFYRLVQDLVEKSKKAGGR